MSNCGSRNPQNRSMNPRGEVRAKTKRMAQTPNRCTINEKLHNEARLMYSPRLKTVSSRSVLNSICLKRLLSASSRNPEPNNSPERDMVSNEKKARIENRNDGMYVLSANAFLSINKKPKNRVCENRIKNPRMCRAKSERPKSISINPKNHAVIGDVESTMPT